MRIIPESDCHRRVIVVTLSYEFDCDMRAPIKPASITKYGFSVNLRTEHKGNVNYGAGCLMADVWWWNIIITDHNFAPIVGMARLACTVVQKRSWIWKNGKQKRENLGSGCLQKISISDCVLEMLVRQKLRKRSSLGSGSMTTKTSSCEHLSRVKTGRMQVHRASSLDTLRGTNENFYKSKSN